MEAGAYPFRRLDSHFFIILRMRKRQLHRLFDLLSKIINMLFGYPAFYLDLSVKSSNVCIALSRSLFQLHDGNHWVGVVAKHTNHSVHLCDEVEAGFQMMRVTL